MDLFQYYFFAALVLGAFVAGFFLVEDNARKIYLAALIVVIWAGVINMNPVWRDKVLGLITGTYAELVKAQVKLQAPPPPVKAFEPFYVYQDKNSNNRFVASGYMADGDCVTMDDAWQDNVQEGRSSIRVDYDARCSRSKKKWAGVYWQNPANNWGDQPGGHDLKGATKLVFWARGEEGGEHILQFKVGGLGVKEQYPDSTEVILKDVILTPEWLEYAIDLGGKDLSRISGGFAWSTNVDVNPDGCIFYLDNIRFE